MANLFELDKRQQNLIYLLQNEPNLSGEERQELTDELKGYDQQKGLALLPLFDMMENVIMKLHYGKEKRDELDNYINTLNMVLRKIMKIIKNVFISTGQKRFDPTPTTTFKRRKLPKRIEIDETAIDNIPDDFKTVTLTVPVTIARIIALDFPQLKLDIDTKKQEVSKIELKKLMESGVEIEGVKLIDDDFTVVKDGV